MTTSLSEPSSSANYITTTGYRRLRDELQQLVNKERPEVTQVVSWAASNGDRSENGDYIYGKRRLREIDRRIRFLTKQLEDAVVVDPTSQCGNEQIFFGARVGFSRNEGPQEWVTIVGRDEVDPMRRRVSWISPVAKALIRAREGDEVRLRTPQGEDRLLILEVVYEELEP